MQVAARTGMVKKYTNEPVRRYPRALFSVPIRLRHLMAGGISTTRGITLDISESGLGALVQGDLRLGETVEIDLELTGWAFHIQGITTIMPHQAAVVSARAL